MADYTLTPDQLDGLGAQLARYGKEISETAGKMREAVIDQIELTKVLDVQSAMGVIIDFVGRVAGAVDIAIVENVFGPRQSTKRAARDAAKKTVKEVSK